MTIRVPVDKASPIDDASTSTTAGAEPVAPSTASIRRLVLDSWRLSILVVTEHLRFKYSNPEGSELLTEGTAFRLVDGAVCCADSSKTPELAARVKQAAASRGLAALGFCLTDAKGDSWSVRLTALCKPNRDDVLVQISVAQPDAAVAPPVRFVADSLGLTMTQARVAVRIVEGKTRKEIAQELGITPDTVSEHVDAIYDRTGARGKVALVRRVLALAL